VSADSNGPSVTVRSSSEHGPDASGLEGLGAGAGLAEGVTVTVTVGAVGGAGSWGVGWAEHPAMRTAATTGSIGFMSDSYKHALMTSTASFA
jgi:hypothetical protein